MDFKPVVKEAYLALIKGALDRVIYFEVDEAINHLLRLLVVDPPQADEVLLISDKFFIYRQLWKAVMETLYAEFLPHTRYEFSWELELTPYTLMLCQLTAEQGPTTELDHLQKTVGLTDEQVEADFEAVLAQTGLTTLGFPNGLAGRLPATLLPTTRRVQLQLLFRLMNFPPLTELALFQNHYNATLQQQLSRLSVGFAGIKKSALGPFGMSEPLRCSYFPIDHRLFQKYGLAGFEADPELAGFQADFAAIRQQTAANKDRFTGEVICPCCGEVQTVTVPEEVLHYKYLIDNKALAIAIGLLHLPEFTEIFLESLSEHMRQFLPEINRIDNPECLILVEGESEEVAIPILAFRKRFVLAKHGIQVFNSKSKEKVAADFLTFRAKYPNRKMICLLDADARKERADIERLVNDHKHKYRLVFIEHGTFEDLFDLAVSVRILNELYPAGEEITVADFDATKDFLVNIKRLMHTKKKAQFDKVLFARTMALQLDVAQIPKEIDDILRIAQDFAQEPGYFKMS